MEIDQQLDDLLAGGRVEIAGGLVGQEQPRSAADGARDGHALLLTPRELDGVVVRATGEADLGEQRSGALERVGLAGQLERDRDVLESGERGDQVVGLEHKPDFAPAQQRHFVLAKVRDVFAIQQHLAAGGRIETGQQSKERTLSATRRSHNCGKLALWDFEIDALQDFDAMRAGVD